MPMAFSGFQANRGALSVAAISIIAVIGWTANTHADTRPVPTAPPAAKSPTEPVPPATGKTKTGVRIELKVPQFPAILPGKSSTKENVPATWSKAEIGAAKARCAAILRRIKAIAIPADPIKEGACGAPAPIQLISIGRNPEIALSPPATVTCEFAEALHTWMKGDVETLARKHLGSDVIRIEVMSSYSCRAAYGRKGNRLSEHALANALDIRGFVTASGNSTTVLADWGTPQREIIARINAEKAKAAKALVAQQAAEKTAQAAQMAPGAANRAAADPAATASSAGAPASGIALTDEVDGSPRLTITLPGAAVSHNESEPVEGLSMAPSRLGGPKPTVAAQNTARTTAKNAKETFLHVAHAAACRIFGTTLGPEANAAHRNHLHVDLASHRGDLKICDH